jgi:hypothetical protein
MNSAPVTGFDTITDPLVIVPQLTQAAPDVPRRISAAVPPLTWAMKSLAAGVNAVLSALAIVAITSPRIDQITIVQTADIIDDNTSSSSAMILRMCRSNDMSYPPLAPFTTVCA